MNKHWLYHAKEFSAERYDIYCDTSLDRNRSRKSEQKMIDRDRVNGGRLFTLIVSIKIDICDILKQKLLQPELHCTRIRRAY